MPKRKNKVDDFNTCQPVDKDRLQLKPSLGVAVSVFGAGHRIPMTATVVTGDRFEEELSTTWR